MMNVQQPIKPNNETDSNHLSNDLQPDCGTIQALIPDYAFGLTDAIENRRIESGLDQCTEAITILAGFRQMQAILRVDVPQIAPPPQLGPRLMAAAANAALPAETIVASEVKDLSQNSGLPAATIMATTNPVRVPGLATSSTRLNRWTLLPVHMREPVA